MAHRLGIDADSVVGKLVRIWSWTDGVTEDGIIAHVTLKNFDDTAHCDGFGSALVAVGWLKVTANGVEMPNFLRHNGQSAKRRATEMYRKRLVRNPSAKRPQNVRTKSGPEREREIEKNKEEKTRGKHPPHPPAGGAMPSIPETLNTEDFRTAWGEWLAYRAERKPKVTPKSAKVAFGRMEGWGPVLAVRAIRESIGNSWQGIFEPRDNGRAAPFSGIAEFVRRAQEAQS